MNVHQFFTYEEASVARIVFNHGYRDCFLSVDFIGGDSGPKCLALREYAYINFYPALLLRVFQEIWRKILKDRSDSREIHGSGYSLLIGARWDLV